MKLLEISKDQLTAPVFWVCFWGTSQCMLGLPVKLPRAAGMIEELCERAVIMTPLKRIILSFIIRGLENPSSLMWAKASLWHSTDPLVRTISTNSGRSRCNKIIHQFPLESAVIVSYSSCLKLVLLHRDWKAELHSVYKLLDTVSSLLLYLSYCYDPCVDFIFSVYWFMFCWWTLVFDCFRSGRLQFV